MNSMKEARSNAQMIACRGLTKNCCLYTITHLCMYTLIYTKSMMY